MNPKNAETTDMFGPKPNLRTTYGYEAPITSATSKPTMTERGVISRMWAGLGGGVVNNMFLSCQHGSCDGRRRRVCKRAAGTATTFPLTGRETARAASPGAVGGLCSSTCADADDCH